MSIPGGFEFPISTDVVNDIGGLTEGSAWATLFRNNPITPGTISLSDYNFIFPNPSVYPVSTEVNPKYTYRPLTKAFIGFTTATQLFVGSNVINGLSILEDDTPNFESITFYQTTNFFDFETEGSFTKDGLLTKSFSFRQNDPGIFILSNVKEDPTISGDDVTYTYSDLKQIFIQRTGLTGASSDTLPDVTDLLAESDFVMANQASSNTTFKFFIKNTDATNDITLFPGTGWSFVSVTIPAKKTVSFWGSVDPVGLTAKLFKIATMDSVP